MRTAERWTRPELIDQLSIWMPERSVEFSKMGYFALRGLYEREKSKIERFVYDYTGSPKNHYGKRRGNSRLKGKD